MPSSGQGRMRLECSLLGVQAGTPAFGLNPSGQSSCSVRAGAEPEPHHTHEPAALECADVAQLELEPGERLRPEPIGDFFNELAIDAADESDGEVQVGRGRPPEVGLDSGARGDESAQLATLGLRHREPEECANPQ